MKKTLFTCIFLLITSSAFAGGLSTTFGEVAVDDLAPGKPYSMEKEAKFPLVINNTSSRTVDLVIEVLSPDINELKPGYEAIPDIAWISIVNNATVIEPGQAASTDVIISVPDDARHLGKKYQVYLWSHTTGTSIGVGLKSKLLLTVRKSNQ